MEQEQVEIQDLGIGIWQFRNVHFVRTRTSWQKSLAITILQKCSSSDIYSDLGNEKDWNFFLFVYNKLVEKIRRENDRAFAL